jgi:hypothetical protein
MYNIKQYLLEICNNQKKSSFAFLFRYVLAVVLISIFIGCIANRYPNELGVHIQGALLYGMISCFVYILYKKLRALLFGRESVFLKKLGFSHMDLLLYALYKLRWHYLVFVWIYTLIFFMGITINIISFLYCLLNATFLFTSIYSILLIYVAILSKFDIMHFLKAALFLPIFSYTNALAAQLDFHSTLQQNIYAILELINHQSISQTLIKAYVIPNFIQVLVLLITLICFVITYLRKPYLIDKPLQFSRKRLYPAKKNTKIRTCNDGMLKAFIKRDLHYIITKFSYFSVQTVATTMGVYLLLVLDEIPFLLSITFLGIVCFFNCMLIQELFYLDSIFAHLYKKLPLYFHEFISARIISTLAYVIWVPMLYLLFGFSVNKLSVLEVFALLAILLLLLLFLCIYFSSVILLFFPSVKHRTDLPLLMSIFLLTVPLVPLIIIYLGIRKGKRDWGAWTHNA